MKGRLLQTPASHPAFSFHGLGLFFSFFFLLCKSGETTTINCIEESFLKEKVLYDAG